MKNALYIHPACNHLNINYFLWNRKQFIKLQDSLWLNKQIYTHIFEIVNCSDITHLKDTI
jgi:hypothetical protein